MLKLGDKIRLKQMPHITGVIEEVRLERTNEPFYAVYLDSGLGRTSRFHDELELVPEPNKIIRVRLQSTRPEKDRYTIRAEPAKDDTILGELLGFIDYHHEDRVARAWSKDDYNYLTLRP